MFLLVQAGPGLGDLVVILFLLLAMMIPVLLVLGVALYITRDEWTGDRKDTVEKDLSEDLGSLGTPDTDDEASAGASERAQNGE
jgi:hypothetical protein